MSLRRRLLQTISYNFAALAALVACACGDSGDASTGSGGAAAGGAGGSGGSLSGGSGGSSGSGAVGNPSEGTGGGTGVGGAGGVATGGVGGASVGGTGGEATGGTGGVGVGGTSGDATGGVGGAGVGGTGGDATGGVGGASTGGAGGTTSIAHCLDGITSYTTDGPFSYTTRRSGQVNIWVPNVPSGCKVPIVHLANGTGATCSSYGAILQHLASHGFLATCYESTQTGQGTQCLTAVQTALSEYPDLADKKVGSTGHSQGGGGAILCVYRVEQQFGSEVSIVGHAMEPAHGYGDSPSNWATLYGQIRSPIFMFNGSIDSLVSARWVSDGFNALADSVEAYWYQAEGARHIPVPTSWTEESTVAWFRWKLLGDTQACQYFKNMPNTSAWSQRASQSATDC